MLHKVHAELNAAADEVIERVALGPAQIDVVIACAKSDGFHRRGGANDRVVRVAADQHDGLDAEQAVIAFAGGDTCVQVYELVGDLVCENEGAAATADHRIVAHAAPKIGVTPAGGDDQVVAIAAGKPVRIALGFIQGAPELTADESIGAATARELGRARATTQKVTAAAADRDFEVQEGVGAPVAGRCARTKIHGHAAGRIGIGHDVARTGAAIQPVVAGPAINRVGAAIAGQRVVEGGPGDIHEAADRVRARGMAEGAGRNGTAGQHILRQRAGDRAGAARVGQPISGTAGLRACRGIEQVTAGAAPDRI